MQSVGAMTVQADTYCGFWMRSLWVLKGVFVIVFLGLMAGVAAGCELTCDANSPGAELSGDVYKCGGAWMLLCPSCPVFSNTAHIWPEHGRTPDR